jgi:nucleotide-binding universal stress UspA family protein
VSLAKRNRAQLTVVEVIEELPREMRTVAAAMPAQELEELVIEERHERLNRLVKPIQQEGIRTGVKVMTGTPFLEIIREVLRRGHDLVIMTAEGKGGLKNRLFGSTSLHLMRKCPCPVWVVKPARRKRYGRILAAVDPDPSDEVETSLNTTSMELATSLANLEESELHVVHAWSLWEHHSLQRNARIPPEQLAQLADEIIAMRERKLEELVEGYRIKDLMRLRVHFIVGEAGEVIPTLAAKKRVDLIVMGTVCRTGLAGFLIGNTAEHVLQQVDCSVLTIKPEGFVSPVEPGDL